MDSSDDSDVEDREWDGQRLARWVRKIARVAPSLASKMRPVFRWTCILVTYLCRQCESLVVRNDPDGDPAVQWYSNDGWAAFVTETCTFTAGGETIVRKGRVRKEFLLERSIVKRIPARGSIISKIYIWRPRAR